MAAIIIFVLLSGLFRSVAVVDWTYDWAEVSSTPGTIDIPSPHADALRTFFARNLKSRADWPVQLTPTMQPKITFFQNGKTVAKCVIHRDPVTVCNYNEWLFRLNREQLDELDSLVKKATTNPKVLLASIKQGSPIQRVRAARALLWAEEENDLAIDVLEKEICGKDNMAAKFAMACCGEFMIRNDVIEASLIKALDDEELKWNSLLTLETLGPRVGRSAIFLRDRAYKTMNASERRLIINALSSIDPESEANRKLFLSFLLERNEEIETQTAVIRGISLYGKRARDSIPLLEKIIARPANDDRSRILQFVAVKSVFCIEPDHPQLVAWLSNSLSDSPHQSGLSTDLIGDTIEMLGKLGPSARSSLPLIVRHKADSTDDQFQMVVSDAIKRIQGW